jgi:hypothetical protein
MIMHEFKTMPFSEKLSIVMDKMKPNDSFISMFVRTHLGEQALLELQKIWKEGVDSISKEASEEEKYNIAYRNLMWRAKNNLAFIRKHLGQDGIEQYKLAHVEELKRQNTSPALLILSLVRAVAPGIAFTMIAKKMAYKLQWLTPFSIMELTRNRAVFNIPHCKVMSFPDMEEVCIVDCQNVYPMWVAGQFKIGLKFQRQGDSCKAILRS